MTESWWKRFPGRLLEEEQAIAALQAEDDPKIKSHRWLRVDGAPRLRVELYVLDKVEEVEVAFPSHYPDGCPSVRPVPHRIVSSHQYKASGILCLELGPDNWHPNHTAADLIVSAWRLLTLEVIDAIVPIDIPSRHNDDLAERVGRADPILVRTPTFDALVSGAAESTDFDYVWTLRHVKRLAPVAFPAGTDLPDVPPAFRDRARKTGRVVLLGDDAPDEVPSEPAGFAAFVETHGAIAVDPGHLLTILRWKSGRSAGFLNVKTKIWRMVDVPFDARATGRMPPALRGLAETSVCIVGMGSLGSKVAVSLARAGVSRFVLVDRDVLLAHNVCRHAAGFYDVGVLKVSVVEELIKDVSVREPNIARFPVNLLSATNPELHAKMIEACAGADVLVDATADPDVYAMLAQISSDHRRPLVWGEVFGDGLGGLVGSAHPVDTSCARCVRAGLLAVASRWPPAPGRDAVNYGDSDGPLAGADPHVSLIAAAMTARVGDLVAGVERLPAVTLFGFKKQWIFDAPIQTVHVPIRADDFNCPRCWRADSAPDADTAAEAEALFEHAENAGSANPG